MKIPFARRTEAKPRVGLIDARGRVSPAERASRPRPSPGGVSRAVRWLLQKRLTERAVCRVLALGSLVLFVVVALLHSHTVAIDLPTDHLDGAFQTASGLFRLHAGQVPGKHFLPYLGTAPVLLLYPAFALDGGHLAASVFAAHFVTLILGWLVTATLCKLVLRPRSALGALAVGAVLFTGVVLLARDSLLPRELRFYLDPGNSLRPVRAAIPYLAAPLALLLVTRARPGASRYLSVGLLLGAILLWSNDYALPTAGLIGCFLLSYLQQQGSVPWHQDALAVFGATLLAWALLLTLSTAGHPLALLQYNFRDVATDQWWFFGAYGEAMRIFAPAHLDRLLAGEIEFPLKVLLVTTIVTQRTKRVEHQLLTLIGLTLLAGGSLASIGGHLGGYFGAFRFWARMTLLLGVLRVLVLFVIHSGAVARRLARALRVPAFALALLVVGGAAAHTSQSYREARRLARNDEQRFLVRELGGYIGTVWRDYLDFARDSRYEPVVEEYWGLWSALNRSIPDWPVDSVIHALGRVRHRAAATLARAKVRISTRYAASPGWQPWNLSQNFWFYDELLASWTPVLVSPTTIVWHRTPKSRPRRSVPCRVAPDGRSFALGPDAEGFQRVRIRYHAAGAGRFLLMLRNNISFGADASGYVSLPPAGSSAELPVFVRKGSGSGSGSGSRGVFDLKVVGNRHASATLLSCAAQTITLHYPEVLHVPR